MSETKWTPGLWRVDPHYHKHDEDAGLIVDGDCDEVARTEYVMDAYRIVACVNGCANLAHPEKIPELIVAAEKIVAHRSIGGGIGWQGTIVPHEAWSALDDALRAVQGERSGAERHRGTSELERSEGE